MRHAHLLFKQLTKQSDSALADQYLAKQTVRAEPAWYGNLLDTHKEEIAAVVLWWLGQLEAQLIALPLPGWTNPFLWIELERMLAERLAPALGATVMVSARRQAVEVGEPIPVWLADLEAVSWSGTEAARQAQLIAGETRTALVESLMALEDAGIPEEEQRFVLLESGAFALNRRFAMAALRPILQGGIEAVEATAEAVERFLEVRRDMIETVNAVSGVNEGIVMAALLWQREGKLITKSWMTMRDELVCPTCASMHMQEVPLRSMFVAGDGETFERPPAHPGCRCLTVIAVHAVETAFDFVA